MRPAVGGRSRSFPVHQLHSSKIISPVSDLRGFVILWTAFARSLFKQLDLGLATAYLY